MFGDLTLAMTSSCANPKQLNKRPLPAQPLIPHSHFDVPTPRPHNQNATMGRVRTKTVKKSSKVIIERYYPKLSLDFETNKRICDEVAIISSKRLRNKIAGYTTHLYGSQIPSLVPTPQFPGKT